MLKKILINWIDTWWEIIFREWKSLVTLEKYYTVDYSWWRRFNIIETTDKEEAEKVFNNLILELWK